MVGAGSRVNSSEYKVVNNTAIADIPSDLLGWLLESVTCEEPPTHSARRETKRRNIDIKPSEEIKYVVQDDQLHQILI